MTPMSQSPRVKNAHGTRHKVETVEMVVQLVEMVVQLVPSLTDRLQPGA